MNGREAIRRVMAGLAVLASSACIQLDLETENASNLSRSDIIAEGGKFVESLSIDTDGEDPVAVSHVALQPGDRIYVVAGGVQEVRQFDAEGNYVRTIGREGERPGEFSRIEGIAVASNGELWVADAGNARYSVFDSTGMYLSSHDIHGLSNCARGNNFGFGPGGMRYDSRSHAPESSSNGTVECQLSVFDGDSLITTFALPTSTSESGSANSALITAFDPGRQVMWSGASDSNRLVALDALGDTVAIVSHDFTPYFASLLVDNQGLLWVGRVGEVDGLLDRFDVFDTDGEHIGSVELETPLVATLKDGRSVPLLIHGLQLVGLVRSGGGAGSLVLMKLEAESQGIQLRMERAERR